MATTEELPKLKEKLLEKKMAEKDVNKVLAYISGALRDEEADKRRKQQEGKQAKTPVTNNTIDMLYTIVFKYFNLGLLVDGVNVVISGRNMAMVKFHGYKNKVLQTYPETQFDVQLVREGDTFSVSKESGAVVYQHNIGDPFGNSEAAIIGAYVVFKNKRGEFIETLNKTDFNKMKDASKQKYLWGEWESEFWLKSVIKRACKRHFYDVVEEIDKNDNDNFGLLGGEPPETNDVSAKVDTAIEAINAATDEVKLNDAFQTSGLMQNKRVVAAWQEKRATFHENS